MSKGTRCSQEKQDIIHDVITSSCSDLSGPRKGLHSTSSQNLDDVVKCQGEDTDTGTVLRAKKARSSPPMLSFGRHASHECQQVLLSGTRWWLINLYCGGFSMIPHLTEITISLSSREFCMIRY